MQHTPTIDELPKTAAFGRSPVRLALIAVGAGACFDIGIRGGPANGLVAAAIVLAVWALFASERLQRSGARRLALAAAVPATFLAVRASPWLALSNLIASVALISAAACYSHSGSVSSTTLANAYRRFVTTFGRIGTGPAYLRSLVPRHGSGRIARVARSSRCWGLSQQCSASSSLPS
ncbi:MAG: hypothetical protein ACT4OX_04360 [Actinomycetota bacterium]